MVIASNSYAQNTSVVIIKIVDSVSLEPIESAFIQLKSKLTSTNQFSDRKGIASFTVLADVPYSVSVSYAGYKTLINKEVDEKNITILLSPTIWIYQSAIVKASQDSILIKGDTTSYNAEKYTTKTDSKAKDVLEKIPGTEIVKGELMVEGKKVQQVLIDGEEYMAGNNKAALDQIPSDIIYRIEIIDNVSSDDPNIQWKSVNIVTKKKTNYFGTLALAYGTDSRYRLGGNYYRKTAQSRFTVMLDANNVNREDLLEDPFQNLFEGDNKFWGGGLNYVYTKNSTKVEFRAINNKAIRKQFRVFDQRLLTEVGSNPFFSTENSLETNEDLLSYNLKLNTKLSKKSSFTFRSSASNYSQGVNGHLSDIRFSDTSLAYQLNANSKSASTISEWSNSLNLSYYFANKQNDSSKKDVLSLVASLNKEKNERTDSLQYEYDNSIANNYQLNQLAKPIVSLKTAIEFTDKRPKNVQINYQFLYTTRSVFNSITGIIADNIDFIGSVEDPTLSGSNSFKTDEIRPHISAGKKWKKLTLFGEIDYSILNIRSQYFLPLISYSLSTNAQLLPSGYLAYKISSSSSFRLNFTSDQVAPKFSDLNPILNNRIPSRLFIGNDNLSPENNYQLQLTYRLFKNKKALHVISATGNVKNNFIGYRFYTSNADSIFLQIALPSGTVLKVPANFSQQKQLRLSANNELNINKLKCGIRYGYNYDYTPYAINGQLQTTSVNRINSSIYGFYYPRTELSISANFYNSYAALTNSGSGSTTNVWNWSANESVTYLFKNAVLFQVESNTFQVINYSFQSNKQVSSIVSSSAKFLLGKHQKSSLQLQVHDLLNQNKDITQNPSEIYITQEQVVMLQRYFLIGYALKF